METKMDYSNFFVELKDEIGERAYRIVACKLALNLGHGGITAISKASGLSRPTLHNGLQESKKESPSALPPGRQRRAGAGRKNLEHTSPKLLEDLESLVKPYTKGDPESPLRWSSKSLRKLSAELSKSGYSVGHVTVGRLLESLGYTLQSNKKSQEGGNSPDRDAQFQHISDTASKFLKFAQPVISVDAKKKELIGNFKNAGREYRPSKSPVQVEVYDFVKDEGRATPYGIYDIEANEGFVNVGTSHDTAAFAVDSIRAWWKNMGKERYPSAHSLYINADGGGSNGSRNRLWKVELAKFADDEKLNIYVSHFPPGTSKWNKIEHRMFSYISMNWRGRPLVTSEIIVNLIGGTTTTKGLKIQAELCAKKYDTKIKTSDDQLASINLLGHSFHPEWNYVIIHKT
ncbi:MAG: ISAzo13 family transposase [Chloroflexi bacterium]|nr:ISAzo13 family transposase [Chloroflexota bacterium]